MTVDVPQPSVERKVSTHVGRPLRAYHGVERACGAEDGKYVDVTMAELASCADCLDLAGVSFASGGSCTAFMPDGTRCGAPLWRIGGDEEVEYACSGGHGWLWVAPWGSGAARTVRDDRIASEAFALPVGSLIERVA